MSKSERFTVMQLEDIDCYAGEGQPHWHMVRAALGIGSFGINAWRATEAGQQVIGEHDEVTGGAGGHEELYLVLSGGATFTVDGDMIDAPAGTLVFVRDPLVKRAAVAGEANTIILVVGGKRGEAFTVSPWETSAEALRFWTTKEWDRAIELLSRQHEEDPENANVVYNLACAESQAGNADAALAHLEDAIALQPSFADSAQAGPDLASIREDPRFPTPSKAG